MNSTGKSLLVLTIGIMVTTIGIIVLGNAAEWYYTRRERRILHPKSKHWGSRFVKMLAFVGNGMAKGNAWYRPFPRMSDPNPQITDSGMTTVVALNAPSADQEYVRYVESDFKSYYDQVFRRAESGDPEAIDHIMTESTFFEMILDQQVVSHFVEKQSRNQRP